MPHSAVHARIPDARSRPWNAASTQDVVYLVEQLAHDQASADYHIDSYSRAVTARCADFAKCGRHCSASVYTVCTLYTAVYTVEMGAEEKAVLQKGW